MNAPAHLPAGDTVLASVRNRIGHLTLNRPAGLNALTLDMVRSLHQQLSAWAADPAVVAVVLRGEGPKGFCAGGDVRALHDSYHAGTPLHEVFFHEEYALDLLIHRYRKPVLALMDGLTLGGGMGLAQGADLRVVTERSRLGMPEVGIGYFPDVGASYFLSRLPGELGTYLGLTGNLIGAADALYCGLADWHVASTDLDALYQALDRTTFSDQPLKDLQGLLASLGAQTLPNPPLASLRPAIDHYFAQADVATILRQLREVHVGDSHAWALDTAAVLASRSPLSLVVTLELLRRGRHRDLEACFAMELHLDRQWFTQGDIVEGVRALLVDKDKQPRWNPPTLAEVSSQQVDRLFEGVDD